MDVASGRVLYAKNAHQKRAPASLTKVMTALVALEQGGLNAVVTVSDRAARAGGSSLWLEPGESLTLRDLVYGLLLRSGNDAAEAIAEHVAGTVDDFVLLMNRRAAALGALDTHFRNPHGLPDLGHLTTAADLAVIARAAMLRPDFREIVATRQRVIPWEGRPWDRMLSNENRFLSLYPGADGVKTGWTREAGRCLIASASRDGWRLVAVLLDATQMWSDACELLDWGFGAFEPAVVFPAGARVARARVAGAAERWVALKVEERVEVAVLPGEVERLAAVPDVPPAVRSPLAEGEPVGSLRLLIDGATVSTFPLAAAEDVPRSGVLGRLVQDLWLLLLGALERLLGRGAAT